MSIPLILPRRWPGRTGVRRPSHARCSTGNRAARPYRPPVGHALLQIAGLAPESDLRRSVFHHARRPPLELPASGRLDSASSSTTSPQAPARSHGRFRKPRAAGTSALRQAGARGGEPDSGDQANAHVHCSTRRTQLRVYRRPLRDSRCGWPVPALAELPGAARPMAAPRCRPRHREGGLGRRARRPGCRGRRQHPLVGGAVAALLLAVLPGRLLLRALRVPRGSSICQYVAYLPCASVAVLVASTLLVDLAGPLVGLHEPLRRLPLLVGLNLVLAG